MNEHALRHPASVTKVMTLYLLFEQLERGRLTLDSEIPISAHAAAQAPSKLGLRPGSTIRVEDAIKVVVTNRPMTSPWPSPRRSAAARANSPN
jgi:D-alanyl-D-alanine carboxypeptidase